MKHYNSSLRRFAGHPQSGLGLTDDRYRELNGVRAIQSSSRATDVPLFQPQTEDYHTSLALKNVPRCAKHEKVRGKSYVLVRVDERGAVSEGNERKGGHGG